MASAQSTMSFNLIHGKYKIKNVSIIVPIYDKYTISHDLQNQISRIG